VRLAILGSDGQRPPAIEPPEGIELELYRMRIPGFARTPYDHLFVEIAYVDAAERAEADGCDGVVLDTFADYGIERMRHSVSLPIFGAGEEGIAVAAERGGTFSIVTVWPRSLEFIYRERLAACRGGDRCAGVHYFSEEAELELVADVRGVAQRMNRHDATLVEQLAGAFRSAIADDGSKAVLCGCTCMSPIADRLQELCDFAVIDSSRVGAMAATAGLLAGARSAERTLSPRRGDVRRFVDRVLDGGDVPQPPDAEYCEPCAVLAVSDAASAVPTS
jgi:allantoin racemase